jgi:hypothetical protein
MHIVLQMVSFLFSGLVAVWFTIPLMTGLGFPTLMQAVGDVVDPVTIATMYGYILSTFIVWAGLLTSLVIVGFAAYFVMLIVCKAVDSYNSK